jgi:hypothetical protein
MKTWTLRIAAVAGVVVGGLWAVSSTLGAPPGGIGGGPPAAPPGLLDVRAPDLVVKRVAVTIPVDANGPWPDRMVLQVTIANQGPGDAAECSLAVHLERSGLVPADLLVSASVPAIRAESQETVDLTVTALGGSAFLLFTVDAPTYAAPLGAITEGNLNERRERLAELNNVWGIPVNPTDLRIAGALSFVNPGVR